MVTDVGGLGDRSFNDSAYAGLVRAKNDLHAATTVLQSRSAADYQINMTVLANKEYDEIFAIGFLMAQDVDEVAERYPKRHFAIIDAVVDRPNVDLGDVQRGRRLVPGRRARRDDDQDENDRVPRRASTSRCCASSRRASPRARARSTRRSRCW